MENIEITKISEITENLKSLEINEFAIDKYFEQLLNIIKIIFERKKNASYTFDILDTEKIIEFIKNEIDKYT